MSFVFQDKEKKFLTPKAAVFVWAVIVPVILITSYVSFTALIIWGSLLSFIAVIATVFGR